MKDIRQSGGLAERNVLSRTARRLARWVLGHRAPGMHCLRCTRRVYR